MSGQISAGIGISPVFGMAVQGIVDAGAPDYLFEDGINFLFEDAQIYEFEN